MASRTAGLTARYLSARLACMKKLAPSGKGETAKTSVRLPKELWRAAHIRALDEERDLQDVIVDAIELYLKTPVKRAKEVQR